MPKAALARIGRSMPELMLAILAGMVFLGCLGSMDLWGKREQRASAEAIDTIRQGHWLVAQIQGRPRLEKPPLPRWTIAILMELTGRRDEWVVRLPSALSALGMVALVYALGCRLGGQTVGRASALVLTSFGFFIVELRQAGNDGPLAFFTILALYAAWRRLHHDPSKEASDDTAFCVTAAGPSTEAGPAPVQLGARGWTILMYIALGLGFLTKGPIILIVVAFPLVPYLLAAGRFREGIKSLASPLGLLLFALLALSWPVPVLLNDPKAAQVWYLEMAQKAGSAGIEHHRSRVLLLDWPWMTAPWLLLTTAAIALPFLPRGKHLRPAIWFPWWWTLGNLAMLCLWKVAKPNYYLPCLPGAAILTGIEWVRLTRLARETGSVAVRALRVLQVHWALLFAMALAAPVIVSKTVPQYQAWSLALGGLLAVAVLTSVWAWRRGANALALAPLVGAMGVGVLVGCGIIAPAFNAAKSHRHLAATLDRLLPPEAHTIMFFHEIDEGLWFYLYDRDLRPVPGSQPRYNDAVGLVDEFRSNHIEWDINKRIKNEERILIDWIQKTDGAAPYVLIRARDYDLFAPDLVNLATPVY
ncbi:MAG TPA: glycosyltransferase family 39 protein, partial [Isosphaeraceae bacterium]|nr:glycosyltransferase family 39 protein [Isosphaeraceae bacterium]